MKLFCKVFFPIFFFIFQMSLFGFIWIYLAMPQEEAWVRQQLGQESCRLPSSFFKTFMVSVARLVGWLGAHDYKNLILYL
jgi:hypothetical protein